MKILLIVLMIVFISCQTTSHKTEPTNHAENSKSDSALKINSVYPLTAEFKDKSDSMILNLNNDQLLISPLGKVFKNKKPLFDIKSKLPIKKLYVQPSGDDFIVFYVFSDVNGAASYAKRISKQGKVAWETPVYAFNMANPLIIDNYAYLSTMGFVGKLNLTDGKYAWKFEDLDKKYESFNEPEFFKDSLVLFTRKTDPMITDSILIDDRKGKIMKIGK